MSEKIELKRVGEIMIPLDKYPHIPYWFTLRQAMAELETAQFEIDGRGSLPRAVLVFDEAYQLLGIVRRRDIMRGLEPRFLGTRSPGERSTLFDVKADPNLAEMSFDKLIRGIREQAEQAVGELMVPVTLTLEAEDHIVKAVYALVENNLSLLPVLQDGKVAGVVRTVDVFHELARIVL